MRAAPVVSNDRDHVPVLDGFRGLAILLVMLCHSFLIGYHPVLRIGTYATSFGLDVATNAGAEGVELFFFISGFVLFLPYARAMFEARPMPSIAHFLDRRFIKIVPSYYLALFFAAFVFYVAPDVAARRMTELFRHAAFIHTFWEQSMGAFSGPFWSIGIEVQFYVLFPLIAACMRRRPFLTFGVLFAIGESFRVWLHVSNHFVAFNWVNQLPAHIDLFGIGMLCAYLFMRFRGHLGRPVVERIALGTGVAALAAAVLLMEGDSYAVSSQVLWAHFRWDNDFRPLVGVTIALLVMSSLFAPRLWRAAIANPVLVWLSVISYNLYLWHSLVLDQCRQTGFPCSGQPMPWLHEAHWDVHFYFAYFIISIGIAAIVTYGFERPLLRIGSRGVFAAVAAPFRRMLRERVALRPVHEPAGDLEFAEQS